MNQKEVFITSEGDRFYERNKTNLTSIDEVAASDPILTSLKELNLQPKRILEIGCSSGWRLESYRRIYDAECFGIDPSSIAVADGAAAFPNLSLHQGTADKLPFKNCTFDLVVFGFCLYLCDRGDLFRIASEADRVLSDNGHIAILDFSPPFPYRNEYKHQPGLYSYKMDYSNMFLWNPAYVLFSKSVLTHTGLIRINEPDERLAVVILGKNSEYAYPANPFVSEE